MTEITPFFPEVGGSETPARDTRLVFYGGHGAQCKFQLVPVAP